MGDSEGFAYETGTVDSDFSDFVEGHCFDGGGIDGGVHGGQGVDFCWGDWFVVKTICVDRLRWRWRLGWGEALGGLLSLDCGGM